jgi:hypothetical protein
MKFKALIAVLITIIIYSCGSELNKEHTNIVNIDQETIIDSTALKKELELQSKYLDKYVFYGLRNLNDGFDAESVKYFSEDDFQIVLQRVKKLEIGILGIEPWKNGEFYDVVTYEALSNNPVDPTWYLKVFEDFKATGDTLQYAASYYVPEDLLKEMK